MVMLLGLGLVVVLYWVFSQGDSRSRGATLNKVWSYVATISLAWWVFRSGSVWLAGALTAVWVLVRVLPRMVKRPAEPLRRGPARSELKRKAALDLFGLPNSATVAEIDARYRQLMREAHPDRGGSEALAVKLNAARQVLK